MIESIVNKKLLKDLKFTRLARNIIQFKDTRKLSKSSSTEHIDNYKRQGDIN